MVQHIVIFFSFFFSPFISALQLRQCWLKQLFRHQYYFGYTGNGTELGFYNSQHQYYSGNLTEYSDDWYVLYPYSWLSG